MPLLQLALYTCPAGESVTWSRDHHLSLEYVEFLARGIDFQLNGSKHPRQFSVHKEYKGDEWALTVIFSLNPEKFDEFLSPLLSTIQSIFFEGFAWEW